jgi:hypothetical protein
MHAIWPHVLSEAVSVHVDDILADSFPASDPPSWTLGYVSPALSPDEPEPHEAEEALRAEPSQAATPVSNKSSNRR